MSSFVLGTKHSNNNTGDNCIITVLDANDLPPLNSDTSLIAEAGNNSSSLPSATPNHNRNMLHRFLIFHRSDQSQI